MKFYNPSSRNFETDFNIGNTLSYGFSDCIRIHLTLLQFSISCINITFLSIEKTGRMPCSIR